VQQLVLAVEQLAADSESRDPQPQPERVMDFAGAVTINDVIRDVLWASHIGDSIADIARAPGSAVTNDLSDTRWMAELLTAGVQLAGAALRNEVLGKPKPMEALTHFLQLSAANYELLTSSCALTEATRTGHAEKYRFENALFMSLAKLIAAGAAGPDKSPNAIAFSVALGPLLALVGRRLLSSVSQTRSAAAVVQAAVIRTSVLNCFPPASRPDVVSFLACAGDPHDVLRVKQYLSNPLVQAAGPIATSLEASPEGCYPQRLGRFRDVLFGRTSAEELSSINNQLNAIGRGSGPNNVL
jgi:hypothetical protein